MNSPLTDNIQFTPDDLPKPEHVPEADIVIYDGKCVFCLRQVRNLKKFDGGRKLAFMSLHDPEVSKRYPDLTYDQMMEQMYVVNQSGEKFGGAAAVRYLSRKLPRLWWAAILTHIPFTLPIQQWFYNQVAKRRYKIANKNGTPDCDDGACAVHFEQKK